MAVQGQGLLGDDGGGPSTAGEQIVYVLHPNCAVEEM
jgi:hypothetical protein